MVGGGGELHLAPLGQAPPPAHHALEDAALGRDHVGDVLGGVVAADAVEAAGTGRLEIYRSTLVERAHGCLLREESLRRNIPEITPICMRLLLGKAWKSVRL